MSLSLETIRVNVFLNLLQCGKKGPMCHKRFIKSDFEKHNSKFHAENDSEQEEDEQNPAEEKILDENIAEKSDDEREVESEGKLFIIIIRAWIGKMLSQKDILRFR